MEWEHAEGGQYARTVIEKVSDKDTPLFPLIDADYMEANSDRVFSPEVLFSLYNTSRPDVALQGVVRTDIGDNEYIDDGGRSGNG